MTVVTASGDTSNHCGSKARGSCHHRAVTTIYNIYYYYRESIVLRFYGILLKTTIFLKLFLMR